MIVFDLECRLAGHRFEGWFASSDDFVRQQETGLLACPQCGSSDVTKAPMAPNLGRKGNQVAAKPASPPPQRSVANESLPPEAVKMMKALAKMQAEAIKDSRWVGDNFAEQSRAMHYGEKEAESIHGQATLTEAKELLDEGIAVAPLPFPVAPPDKAN
jgi:hypothetical protein